MMQRISVRTRGREAMRDTTTWQRIFLAEWDGPRTQEIGAIVVASE